MDRVLMLEAIRHVERASACIDRAVQALLEARGDGSVVDVLIMAGSTLLCAHDALLRRLLRRAPASQERA
jgi:hypothetical protein